MSGSAPALSLSLALAGEQKHLLDAPSPPAGGAVAALSGRSRGTAGPHPAGRRPGRPAVHPVVSDPHPGGPSAGGPVGRNWRYSMLVLSDVKKTYRQGTNGINLSI